MRKIKRKKLKEILINLMLLFVVILFCFSLAEIGIRTFGDKKLTPDFWPSKNTKFIPELRRALYPNLINITKETSEFSYLVNTNNEGFRDFHPIPKKEDIFRIVALGDSLTFGYTLNENETYPKLLEKSNQDLEVINLGIGGFSTMEEYIIFKNHGLRYNPDLVFVQISLNDFYESYFYNQRTNVNEKRGIIREIYKNSKFINWAYWKIKISTIGYKIITSLKLNKNMIDELDFTSKLITDDYNQFEEVNEGIEIVKSSIEKIKKLCDENNCSVVIFYIPAKYQIIAKELKKVKDEFQIDIEKLSPNQPQKILSSFAKEQNIAFIGFSKEIRNEQKRQNLYWKFDGHLNKEGQEFLTKLINSYLHNNYDLNDKK